MKSAMRENKTTNICPVLFKDLKAVRSATVRKLTVQTNVETETVSQQ
jgi:hypothetical protein